MTEGSLGGRAAANSRCLAFPEVDLQPPPLPCESQLPLACQPADSHEDYLLWQFRSLLKSAQRGLAVFVEISPDRACRVADLNFHAAAPSTPPPPAPARTACPSRGTSLPRWSGARGPARACRCAGRAWRRRGGSA